MTLHALAIREQCDPASKQVGKLLEGSVVYVLKARELTSGVRRALIAVARDNAKPRGWVYAMNNGNWQLEIEGGGDSLDWKASSPSAAASNSPAKGGRARNRRGSMAASSSLANEVPKRKSIVDLTAAEITAVAATQLNLAHEADALLEQTDALPTKLGAALVAQKISVDEYLRQWDLGSANQARAEPFRWLRMPSNAFRWLPMVSDSFGYFRTPLGSFGLLQIPSDSYGFLLTASWPSARVHAILEDKDRF